MRISDWSSVVFSSDLRFPGQQMERDRVRRKGVEDDDVEMARGLLRDPEPRVANDDRGARRAVGKEGEFFGIARDVDHHRIDLEDRPVLPRLAVTGERPRPQPDRSEEHTSELQSLMRISYAVFCLKKKTNNTKDD